jgi:hypothetical protein
MDQSKHQEKQQVIITNKQERNPAEQQIDQNQAYQEQEKHADGSIREAS